MRKSSWTVEFHPACEEWANELTDDDAEALLAAIRVLRDEGPNLGRPLVDTVVGSRHPNMKELRPGSTGRTEIRVLFAFDLERAAMLLIGGDKSADWSGWYTTSIPIADERFEQHQAAVRSQGEKTKKSRRTTKKQRKGKRR